MLKKSESGLTLVEIIVSIAIISIIIVALLPLFTMSAKSNSKSKSTLESTYEGKDDIEIVYHYINKLMTNDPNGTYQDFFQNLKDELTKEESGKKKYIYDNSGKFFEYEYSDGKYSKITITPNGNLARVIVEVYKDKNESKKVDGKKEAQYESLYSWKKR